MSTIPKQPSTFRERDDWIRAVLASDLPHVAVRLAVRIAHHLHIGTGRCDPSYAALAAGSHIGERSVYRLVAPLEHTGLVPTQRTRGRHSNQYVLLNPATAMTGLNPDRAGTGLNPANPDYVDNPTLTGWVSNPDSRESYKKRRKAKRKAEEYISQPPDFFAEKKEGTPNEEKAEKNLFGEAVAVDRVASKPDHPKPDTDAAFDRFWSVYPKKVAKLAARKAFEQAISKHGVDPERLIEGAKRYAAERAGQDPKYTRNPATWLNGGCWEDEAPPRAGGPPTLDGVTGEEVPTPRPRSNNGSSSWVDNAAAVASWLKYGSVS
jgi:hypothetical protein